MIYEQSILVSVIIPVYNVCTYVHESINSVIHQTYPCLEIIIIDDGSTDGSGEICDEFARIDNRIKVIHTENKGLSAARNTGLQMVTGDIISFLDSDDAFVPDAIKTVVYSMKKYDTDITMFGFTSIKTDGQLVEGSFNIQHRKSYIPPVGLYQSKEILRLLFQGNKLVIAAWSLVYKASLWKGLSFPEGYLYEDSYIMPIVIERAEKIAVLSEILILNRRREGSITSTYTEKNMRDQLRALHFLSDYVAANTPGTFDRTLPLKKQEDEIGAMIKYYCLSKDSHFRKELREEIIDKAKSFPKKDIRLITWIRIIGIRFIPDLFSWTLLNCLYRRRLER